MFVTICVVALCCFYKCNKHVCSILICKVGNLLLHMKVVDSSRKGVDLKVEVRRVNEIATNDRHWT